MTSTLTFRLTARPGAVVVIDLGRLFGRTNMHQTPELKDRMNQISVLRRKARWARDQIRMVKGQYPRTMPDRAARYIISMSRIAGESAEAALLLEAGVPLVVEDRV